MKIVVLGGGSSAERQISLDTSIEILQALRKNGHKAIFVDMLLDADTSAQMADALFEAEDGLIANFEQSRLLSPQEAKEIVKKRHNRHLGNGVAEICSRADFVFIGLHGEGGEDGKIQALLDLSGIPYNGSDTLGSAVAMNKEMARHVMRDIGILVAPLTRHAPCIVKPVDSGSSIGLKLCQTEQELEAALAEANSDKLLIEKRIIGREFTVPVLGERALVPVELIPPKGCILDYEVKYADGDKGKKIICPAVLSPEISEKLRQLALHLHKHMHQSVYSRTDFIVDEQGQIWCLEINTLPGMTSHSALPVAAAYEGMDFPALCEEIIRLSLNKG